MVGIESRVSDQNGTSPLYIMLEIHHSGREPTRWRRYVRKVRRHGVVRETLKAQKRNFVLDPRFNWKPVECSEQWCSTHMPGLSEDYSGSMILYALKLIQFIVRETSKWQTAGNCRQRPAAPSPRRGTRWTLGERSACSSTPEGCVQLRTHLPHLRQGRPPKQGPCISWWPQRCSGHYKLHQRSTGSTQHGKEVTAANRQPGGSSPFPPKDTKNCEYLAGQILFGKKNSLRIRRAYKVVFESNIPFAM